MSHVIPVQATQGWERPLPLVSFSRDGPTVVRDTIRRLPQDHAQLSVAAILGAARKGKSHLWNLVAQEREPGFEVSDDMETVTRGVWCWCVAHPAAGTDSYVLLLDTEGTEDATEADRQKDAAIGILAYLVSDVLVYNVLRTIETKDRDCIEYVTVYGEEVRRHRGAAALPAPPPHLVLAIRDCQLALRLRHQVVSPEQLMQHKLKLGERVDNAFRSAKCLIFWERLDQPELSDETAATLELLKQRVYGELTPDTTVTAAEFEFRLNVYVKAIRNREVPEIPHSLVSAARARNTEAKAAALQVYRAEMKQHTAVFLGPVPGEAPDPRALHDRSSEAATAEFHRRGTSVKASEFLADLQTATEAEFASYVRDSNERCSARLQALLTPIRAKLKSGYYTGVTAVKKFTEDRDRMISDYNNTEGLGLMALEVRRSFLSMLEPAEDGIRETLLQRVWDFVCGVGLGLVSNSAAKYALDKAASVAVGVAEIVLK